MNSLAHQRKSARLRAVALFKRDDFEELGLLGEGFFSRVFKVQHKSSKNFFVLKLPKYLPDSTEDQKELTKLSLLHEIQVLQRLNHPNVLRLVGQCIDGETPNILIEFVNRETLENLLADKQIVLGMVARVRLSLEIADALAYLHANGIFHKDLSSKNVLIRDNCVDGQPTVPGSEQFSAVIADLGLATYHRRNMRRSASSEDVFAPQLSTAKQRADNRVSVDTAALASKRPLVESSTSALSPRACAVSTSSLSSESSLCEDEKELLGRSEYGSAWWKAPEQIVGGEDVPYTDRADVYSLGILLAELVTRLPAVPDPGLIPRHDCLGFALDFEKFRVHPQVPVDAPNQLIALIGACCQVEPTRRPSAKQVETGLRLVLTDLMRRHRSLIAPIIDASCSTESTASKSTNCNNNNGEIVPQPVLPAATESTGEMIVRTKSHRVSSKPKSTLQGRPSRQQSERIAHDSGWSAKRERDFYRTLRPVIAHRFTAALEALKPRRRSASLSRISPEASAQI